MNYCPHGSMHNANPRAPDLPAPKKGKKAQKQPLEIYKDGRDIPEPLVWKWFEDLAKACVLLEEGKDIQNDPTGRLSGHHVIVHRDIKPANIFLDLPSNVDGDWPDYPVATLGDFGKYSIVSAYRLYHPLTASQDQHATPTRKICTIQCPTITARAPLGLGLLNCAR
jgi:serine/threonine protein kinase